MPELPEVETTRRGLLASEKGRRIESVELRRADLRVPFPRGLAAKLAGATILDVRRRAKYLLLDLNTRDILLVHLGMSGSFSVLHSDEHTTRKHDHALFELDNGTRMVFHDPRRFGVIDLLPAHAETTHKLLAHLGPEPLSDAFSETYLKTALSKRSGPIKTVLMDQKLVVGVGNIYASESLFKARIHPAEIASKSAKKVAAIIPSIRSTLEAAIASGGSTLRDYVGANGSGGYFQHEFLVYERDGKPCFVCGTTIQHLVQAARSSYFCPRCQQNRATRRKT
ncbi:MAG: bifunctional DNA-formamidopyrimidine glycosylase/DNA-(apurinic or apyrimidinic site) lyase [Rickettsiales bacterium]